MSYALLLYHWSWCYLLHCFRSWGQGLNSAHCHYLVLLVPNETDFLDQTGDGESSNDHFPWSSYCLSRERGRRRGRERERERERKRKRKRERERERVRERERGERDRERQKEP